jgi:hypothetical protein
MVLKLKLNYRNEMSSSPKCESKYIAVISKYTRGFKYCRSVRLEMPMMICRGVTL